MFASSAEHTNSSFAGNTKCVVRVRSCVTVSQSVLVRTRFKFKEKCSVFWPTFKIILHMLPSAV